MNVKGKYLKDEQGNIISPIVSFNTVMDKNGNSLSDTFPKVTESTLELTEYIDESSVDMNYVVRYGNVVMVEFRAKTAIEIPNDTPFLFLPYQPVREGTFILGIGSRYSFDEIRWAFYLSTNKQIRDGYIPADKYIHIHFLYICW